MKRCLIHLELLVITGTTSSDRWLTYEDVDNGIKIDYPANWTDNTDQSINSTAVKLVAPKAESSINIIVKNTENPLLSSSTFVDTIISLQEVFPEFTLEDSSEDIIANITYGKLTYTSKFGQNYHKTLQLFTIVDHKNYIISYVSNPNDFDKHLPLVEKMLDSFRIISDNSTTSSDRWLTYEDVDNGIKIDYPANWKKITNEAAIPIYNEFDLEEILTFVSPLELSSFSILTQVFNYNMTLDIFALQNIKELRKSQPEFKLISYNSTFIDGHPAIKIISNSKSAGFTYTDLQILVIIGTKLYLIGLSTPTDSFLDYFQSVEKMLDSFRIISDNGTYIIR